jgi:hypothetical protein
VTNQNQIKMYNRPPNVDELTWKHVMKHNRDPSRLIPVVADYYKASLLCQDAIKINPKEKDAYVLLNLIARQTIDLKTAVDVCVKWGENCCHSSKQFSSLIEALYLSDLNSSSMKKTASEFADYNQPKEVNFLYLKVFCAALIADSNLFDEADKMLERCEGVALDDNELSELLVVFSSWCDLCSNDDAKIIRGKTKLESVSSQKECSANTFGHDVSVLAGCLLVLYSIEHSGIEDSKKLMMILKLDEYSNENVMIIKALIDNFTDGKSLEGVEHKTNGANLILKKHLMIHTMKSKK